MGGGHGKSRGGMPGMGMRWVANEQAALKPMDGSAEQMALFVAYFSPDP
jgi:hypothetical protein